MVNRQPLECQACGTRIVTRTSIGHGDSQVHAFPCPGCGVGITYKVVLDQRNAGIEYDPRPENASWVGSEDGAEHEVTFDAEYLLPRCALTTPFLTPFIAVSGLFQDVAAFQRQEAVRLSWRKNVWPVTRRLSVHFKNQKWDLFDADAKRIKLDPDEDSILARLRLLQRAYDLPFGWMLFPDEGRRTRINQRIALAQSISSHLVAELARQYLESGRLVELWRQLQEFHEAYVTCFPTLSPLLQPKLYWRDPTDDLTGYAVCDKRFRELKPLYIESFETLARVSVIAIAFEAIIHHLSLEIPAKKRALNLWSFEKLANAKKPHHLDKYPIHDLFSPHFDTALRNGIGHNAARYDSAEDEVVCIKQMGSKLSEQRLNYTAFCHRTLELASVLYHSERYFFALLEQTGGDLKSAHEQSPRFRARP
jgi:hypothetical protein